MTSREIRLMVPSQPSVLIGSRPRSYLFGFLFSLSAGLLVVIIQFGWPREIFLVEEGVTSRYVVRAEPYGASSARLCVRRMGAGLRYTARNSFREAIQVWQGSMGSPLSQHAISIGRTTRGKISQTLFHCHPVGAVVRG